MTPVCTPLSPGLTAYQESWTAFAQLLGQIAAALENLRQDAIWPIVGTSGRHIGDVSVADFEHKFGNISWTLTDKDYSDLNGGVGAVVSRFEGGVWQNAAQEIRASDFAVYMRRRELRGATYLALHETAHTTELGLQLNNMLFDQFIQRGGDPNRYPQSSQWLYNEATANLIARTVAEAIDFPIMPDPTGGFPSIMIRRMEIA